jgi:hypothetical protein
MVQGQGQGISGEAPDPDEPTLWKLDRFEDFIAARRKLTREKFSTFW